MFSAETTAASGRAEETPADSSRPESSQVEAPSGTPIEQEQTRLIGGASVPDTLDFDRSRLDVVPEPQAVLTEQSVPVQSATEAPPTGQAQPVESPSPLITQASADLPASAGKMAPGSPQQELNGSLSSSSLSPFPSQPTDAADGATRDKSDEGEPLRSSRKRPRPGERRMQILQMLAEMLESPQADRVTTAALAARLQVSEAALYRHFASKAQMFEGLIGFIEQTLFGLINQITAEEEDGFVQLRAIFSLLLTFAERNPGMTRVLIGDALVTEADRLQDRINQLTDRLELSIKQCYRTLMAQGRLSAETDPAARANLMMACVQGRWLRFAKAGFKRPPTEWLDAQLAVLIRE